MRTDHIVVIGAGVGGLCAALRLAASGVAVTLLERGSGPGGKMRGQKVGEEPFDGGPTVFTMRWVFDEIFAEAGEFLDDHVALKPLDTLARHAWSASERLDLFADIERSADAIGQFAGAAEAMRFRRFCAEAKSVYDALDRPFINSAQPSLTGLIRSAGSRGLAGLSRIKPFTSLWRALGAHFHDPRLRQLFGRYATYCGSSPFRSPATLMLVAHVEGTGVWSVAGGMRRLAEALANVATRQGVVIRYDTHVSQIITTARRASGVMLANGEQIAADAIVAASDVSALAQGLLGQDAKRAAAAVQPRERSLSAMTWMLNARTSGFPLLRHSVFFSRDYKAEFDDIFSRSAMPREPTVYVCAQDREDRRDMLRPVDNLERLLVLINAPPNGDRSSFGTSEIEQCAQRTFAALERCGLTVERREEATTVTTPHDFAQLYPATGGALYGRSSHGWMASFRRPGVRSRVPGLYLAGGSVHPGPGVPMAALSGRMAAECLLTDLPAKDSASIATSRRAATRGGMSTGSATTASTGSR